MHRPIKIFFCYAHEDEELFNKLKAHLRPLQREGFIDVWYDRDISAGTEWEKEISKHLNEAEIILLLITPDFMNSDYCYSIEMKRALERHERGEAHVIPIILRPVHWQVTPLSKLQALPTDARAVTDRIWHTLDEAFLIIVEGIRNTMTELLPKNSVGTLMPQPISIPPKKALNRNPDLEIQRKHSSGQTFPPTAFQPYISLPQNVPALGQKQERSSLPNPSQRSFGKRTLSLLGTLIGFALTAFGILGLSEILYFSAISSSAKPPAFTISGIAALLGIFIFCRSASVIVGKYIGYVALLSGSLLILSGYFANQSLSYIVTGAMVAFIGLLFIIGTRIRG
jgi:TIR domain